MPMRIPPAPWECGGSRQWAPTCSSSCRIASSTVTGSRPRSSPRRRRSAPRPIVTVDNGIASHDGVAFAAARGIEVLITDHHLPAAALPAPAIIVNPNQPGCAFPAKQLAGVGVMFYVLSATRALLRARGHFARHAEPNLAALTDLVALGTIADVVGLDRVNRVLVAHGLARIRSGRAQPGIEALFKVAGRDWHRASCYDLGFVAGPRINAAGRLADMTVGIRCLLAETAGGGIAAGHRARSAQPRAAGGRGDDAGRGARRAGDAYRGRYRPRCVHAVPVPPGMGISGVVGIVAGRLKDRYHRPAIVFAPGSAGELKGSGRSIAGFHLRDALDLVAKRAPGILAKFGGHAYAAGVTLAEADLPRFAALFESVAREQLTPGDLARTVASDGGLAPGELTTDLGARARRRRLGPGVCVAGVRRSVFRTRSTRRR